MAPFVLDDFLFLMFFFIAVKKDVQTLYLRSIKITNA